MNDERSPGRQYETPDNLEQLSSDCLMALRSVTISGTLPAALLTVAINRMGRSGAEFGSLARRAGAALDPDNQRRQRAGHPTASSRWNRWPAEHGPRAVSRLGLMATAPGVRQVGRRSATAA